MNRDYSKYIKGHISSGALIGMIEKTMKIDINIISLFLLLVKSTVLIICKSLLDKSIKNEKEIDRQIDEREIDDNLDEDVKI